MIRALWQRFRPPPLQIPGDIDAAKHQELNRDNILQLLSHDMRSPLASIIALSRHPATTAEASENQNTRIRHNAETLLHLIDDFVFSMHANKKEYTQVDSLIDGLLDDAVYQIRELAQLLQVKIELDLDDAPQFILADQVLMARMLSSLLATVLRRSEPNSRVCIQLLHDLPPSGPVEQAWVHCHIYFRAGFADAEPHAAATHLGFGLNTDFIQTVVHKHRGTIDFNWPDQPGTQGTITLRFPLLM